MPDHMFWEELPDGIIPPNRNVLPRTREPRRAWPGLVSVDGPEAVGVLRARVQAGVFVREFASCRLSDVTTVQERCHLKSAFPAVNTFTSAEPLGDGLTAALVTRTWFLSGFDGAVRDGS